MTRQAAASRPAHLTPVPRAMWPRDDDPQRQEVLISRDFLVQVFAEKGAVRLSVCRTTRKASGGWDDEITWDELQQVKAEAGYQDQWAVEVFPPDSAVVNVANMRHLWVVDQAPAFAWHRDKRRDG